MVKTFCIITLFFFLAFNGLMAQSCDSLVGNWINQDSSLLIIHDELDGRIAGLYQSVASNDRTVYPCIGMVNRSDTTTAIAFHVSWSGYGSITGWTGYCREKLGIPTITTAWHLVRPSSNYEWNRFTTNVSTFVPLVP